MSRLKPESPENTLTVGPSLTQQIVQTRGPQFFTLRNLCLAQPSIQAITTEVRQLLEHVIKGQQNEAMAMISKNPELLLRRSTILDYSDRTIIGTAFQIALGAGDQPMWEEMLRFFEDLEPGEALRQFQEQFPNGIEDEAPSINYNAIATAIIQDVDHHGAVALETFRQEITFQKEITQGKHFNLQHLSAAYQAYADNFGALTTQENRNLFWQQVIGYVQRQMTTYDAQIHCSGVHSVLAKNSSFCRTLSLGAENRDFFPLQGSSGLGFGIAVYSYRAVRGRGVGARARGAPPGVMDDSLKNYVEQKQTRLQDLESLLSKGYVINPIN